MLTVWFGHDWEANIKHERLFNNCFIDEWLNNELVKKMIKDIDKSEVLSPYCIESPYLGQIAPERLSGGVKGLMLMMFEDDFYTDLIIFGENCCKWLALISKMKDVKCSMSGSGLFFRGIDSIDGYCENNGKRFTSHSEWMDVMTEYGHNNLHRGRLPKDYVNGGVNLYEGK